MFPSFIITLRETLEMAMIIGLILAYLKRSRQSNYRPIVWWAALAGIIASATGALLIQQLTGELTGRTEELYEGITTLIGAILLTTMIFWVMRQGNMAEQLRQQASASIERAKAAGLFLLVFVSILREGIETVLYLNAARFISTDHQLVGATSGIVAAILIGYFMFRGTIRLNTRRFFIITNIILILFAAGLMAHSVHEFQEAGAVPVLGQSAWNINPQIHPDGSYPLWHENGYLGSIFKGLVGYNGDPTVAEVTGYLLYLMLMLALWYTNKRQTPAAITTQ